MTIFNRFRRLLLFFVLPQILFVVVAFSTDDLALKHALNIVEQAIAAGICVAYAPGTLHFLLDGRPTDSSEILSFGIALTWTASFLSALFSIVWLAHGEPLNWLNSDAVNYIKFMYVCGGSCHLAAPSALKDRMPARRWIQIGIGVTIATLLSLMAVYAADKAVKVLDAIGREGLPIGDHDFIAGPPPADYKLHAFATPPAAPVAPDGNLSDRICAGITSETRARIEQYRVSHGLHSQAEAERALIAQGLADDDRDASGPYEPEKAR